MICNTSSHPTVPVHTHLMSFLCIVVITVHYDDLKKVLNTMVIDYTALLCTAGFIMSCTVESLSENPILSDQE